MSSPREITSTGQTAEPAASISRGESQPDYSWAEYLDYMEGGGSDVVSLPVTKPAIAEKAKEQPLWGVLLAVGVTLAAVWLSTLPFWPFTLTGAQGRATHPIEPVMLAIVLGMALSNLWALPKALHAGSPAGLPYSPEAGETATIVKLARVCLLAPMVFVIGAIYSRRKLKETGVGPAAREKKIN